jgi:hypothetical protein
MTLVEPSSRQVLDFCARSPVERVFLEDVARRGLGHFTALETPGGELAALCHVGANVVPSGEGCEAFAEVAARGNARMLIGESGAVSALWASARSLFPDPREDRTHQPVYVLADQPAPGGSALRAATRGDVDRLVPACVAAHELELGPDPAGRDLETFRWRTESQVDEGRSWLWLEDDVVLFKAEASAWTPDAVQIQQVWVDPEARGRGYASRGLRDLCRLLLETTPAVTLFVRTENAPAIALYESIGMTKALEYRTVLL